MELCVWAQHLMHRVWFHINSCCIGSCNRSHFCFIIRSVTTSGFFYCWLIFNRFINICNILMYVLTLKVSFALQIISLLSRRNKCVCLSPSLSVSVSGCPLDWRQDDYNRLSDELNDGEWAAVETSLRHKWADNLSDSSSEWHHSLARSVLESQTRADR